MQLRTRGMDESDYCESKIVASSLGRLLGLARTEECSKREGIRQESGAVAWSTTKVGAWALRSTGPNAQRKSRSPGESPRRDLNENMACGGKGGASGGQDGRDGWSGGCKRPYAQ
ncbi:hypothetical protein H1C71_029945 [Ictidomys tridecemlineatus]|nr:hypothetical protein H1C71_029945 [Ictidomys tridecemlineatus]